MKMVADSMVRVVSMPTGCPPTQTATQAALRGGHQTVYDRCLGGEDEGTPGTAAVVESASRSVNPVSLTVIAGLPWWFTW